MHYKKINISLMFLSLVAVISMFYYQPRVAANGAFTCQNKTIALYVRGSGQLVDAQKDEKGYEDERDRLKDLLHDRVNDKNFEFKELVDNKGYKYIATPVTGSLKASTDGLKAIMSSGSSGAYVKSRDSGVELLSKYLEEGGGNCYALIGYSQGADVIGQYLVKNKNKLAQNIIYVGLLGDPKLDLHGYGLFAGSDIPWYRGNAVPILQGGILGGRRPDYLPRLSGTNELLIKSGSWCYDDDIVCTSNILGGVIDGGHGKYVARAMPEIAQEIANVIYEKTQKPVLNPECGARKQDVALVLNTSPSVMADDIFWSPEGQKKIVDGVLGSGCDVNVGMVTFGRRNLEAVTTQFDITNRTEELGQTLSSLRNDQFSDVIEKTNVQDAIMEAMNLTWRPDAQKAVIVISDAPGDNYELDNRGLVSQQLMLNTDMQNIIKKSRSEGGIEIHATRLLHPDWQRFKRVAEFVEPYDYLNGLVQATAGTFSNRANCDWCAWNSMSFGYKSMFANKPAMRVASVRLKVGQSITLSTQDVSNGLIKQITQSPNGAPKYTWYTDCNNVAAQTDVGQTITFAPTKPGSCNGAVGVCVISYRPGKR